MHRADFAGRVRGVEETPQGGLRVPAAVTRPGVFTYSDGNGNSWGEYRPPEEVHAADSLATLRDAPVTVLHPAGLVTRDTWDDVAVGHGAADAAPEEGGLVTQTLVVQSGPAVARVKSGELCETSCGYTCDLDESPGVDAVSGLPYARIQRGIRYNHVALGPEGWARGGPSMALRMDGVAVEVRAPLPADSSTRTDSAGAPAKDTTRMKTIKIKGKTYRLDDESEMVEAQKKADEMEGEVASGASANVAISAELAATKKAMIEIAQKLSALEVQIAAEEAAEGEAKPAVVTEADVPEAVQDSIVARRGALLATAKAMLPATVKLDGLKAHEIKAKVVAHALPTVKLDGLGADTIEGLFLAATTKATEQQQKRADGDAKLSSVLSPTAEQAEAVKREDGAAAAESPAKSLQQKLIQDGAAPLQKGTK